MRFKRGFFGSSSLTLTILIILSILILTAYLRETDEGVIHRMQSSFLGTVASVQSPTSSVIMPLINLRKFLGNIGGLSAENSRLKTEISDLKQEIISLVEAKEENMRLKKLINFKEGTPHRTTLARVIGRSTDEWQSTLILDKGSDDGVYKNMPVVVAEGLVGQVIMVTESASKVRLLIDPRSGVSAQLMKSRGIGIAEGDLNTGLTLNYIESSDSISEEELVLTSGLGGVYPRGLLIGQIESYKETPDMLYKKAKIKSKVDFSGLEEVLVILDDFALPAFEEAI